MKKNGKNDVTRERLLDKAEALFAQKGYHAVSVRELTAAAKCNLAAVNYHFGNKQNLYHAVFRERWVLRAKRIRKVFLGHLEAHASPTPAMIIRALAKAFLEGPLTDLERQRHHQLMARELAQPTEAFEVVTEEAMKPFFRELAEMLLPFMPEGQPTERLALNLLSVFAQVIYFNFGRAAVSRMTGRDYDRDFKAHLVEHIQAFCLEGMDILEGRALL
jgi:AcrR family transcriptional regulator